MYKKLLILCLLLLSGILFFSSTALADPVNPTRPFYPVLGGISLPPNFPAGDLTIKIYHKDQPDDFIYTTLNDDNNYILNIFQLYSEKDVDIVFEQEDYKIELVHNDIDNYDVTATIFYDELVPELPALGNPQNIKFPSIKGQLIINFSLAETMDKTINLEITHGDGDQDGSDDDIIITFPGGGAVPPQIYYLLGDGTGKYVDTYNATWLLINPQNLPLGFTLDLQQGKLVLINQYGAGNSEIYVKAIQPPFADDAQKLQVFHSAMAVGKFNFNVQSGYNLVSVPFNPKPSASLNDVFGTQLNKGVKQTADRIQSKKGPNVWSYAWVYLGNDGKWHDVDKAIPANPVDEILPFEVEPQKGYYIINNGNVVTITVLGEVPKQVTYSLAGAPTGYNNIGAGFPQSLNLDTAGLELVANKGTRVTADRIQLKKGPTLWSYYWVYLNEADNKWYDVDTNQPISELNPDQFPLTKLAPPSGYIYILKGKNFDWNRSLQ